MTTPEVKENFSFFALAQEVSLGSQKKKGCHPIVSVDMYPQASEVGFIL